MKRFQMSYQYGVLFLALLASLSCLAQSKDGDVHGQSVTLNTGDSIRVTIFDIPELSLEHVQVGIDGSVKLPLIGDIHIGGLSASEAAHVIDKAYRDNKFVLHPQASVLILGFAPNGVSITGEVAKPGNYPVEGERTLLDIIAAAGGLTPMADTRVTIQHSNGKLEENISLPLDSGSATFRANVAVSPGDKVVVQRAGTIYVLGDVGRPGGYLMQHNGKMTALQAIAQANGTLRTSGENHAYLVRQKGESYTTQALPLRDMYKGKLSDISLSAGDVIYVPSSNARNFVFNAPNILGSLAGAAIYSVGR